MTYFVLIIITVCGAYFAGKNKNNHIFAVGTTLFPVIVSGLRDLGIGTDTAGTYLRIYAIAQINFRQIRDIGFGFLNFLIGRIFHNFNVLLFVCALITYGLVFYRIFKTSKSPVFSVFLFFATDFFFISMNMVRQSIVIAIFIYILPYVHNHDIKSKIMYFLMALISFTIHSSGIILIPAYFVFRYWKMDIKKGMIYSSINIIFSSVICNILINLLMRSMYFNRYFSWYFSSGYNTGKIGIYSVLIPFVMMILLCYLFWCHRDVRDDVEINDLFLCLFLSGNISMYATAIPLTNRITIYFFMQIIIYLPLLLSYIKRNSTRQVVAFCVFTMFFLYMIITIYIQGQEAVLPYKSIIF